MKSVIKIQMSKKNEITVDDIQEACEGLWQQLDRERTIKFKTGKMGMQAFNDAMRWMAVVQPAIERADTLLEKETISSKEHESLVQMLKSPDHEAFDLAEAIITQKEEPKCETLFYNSPLRITSTKVLIPKKISSGLVLPAL